MLYSGKGNKKKRTAARCAYYIHRLPPTLQRPPTTGLRHIHHPEHVPKPCRPATVWATCAVPQCRTARITMSNGPFCVPKRHKRCRIMARRPAAACHCIPHGTLPSGFKAILFYSKHLPRVSFFTIFAYDKAALGRLRASSLSARLHYPCIRQSCTRKCEGKPERRLNALWRPME